MKKRRIITLIKNLTKPTLAAIVAAVAVLASAPAQAGTGWAHGGNWGDLDGNLDGIHYWDGISNTTTVAEATNVANLVAHYYKSLGINFVRMGINPVTIASNLPVTEACVNTLTQNGMNVDLCCFYIDWTGGGTITNQANWENMWKQVDGIYSNNTSIYYEPINEPFGYNLSGLENLYSTFLGFIKKNQGYILLDGTNYAANVVPIGADSAFNNCLLALHIYPGWGGCTSEAQYKTYLTNHVGSYYNRTIITETGATTDTGKTIRRLTTAMMKLAASGPCASSATHGEWALPIGPSACTFKATEPRWTMSCIPTAASFVARLSIFR